jgi:L,D-transpeptidase ErfK/SrfK
MSSPLALATVLAVLAAGAAQATDAADAPGATAPALEAFASLPEVRGAWRSVLVEPGDTLLDIAYRERLGFEGVQRLNPDVDPWIPVPGSVVRLPTRYLPPAASAQGLVVNVPEMRLYDFSTGPEPAVFHVAVGDAEDPTPVGEFEIGEKRTDPAWRVPESIQREKPELPPVVPPGPDNPLGSRWLSLGTSSYGIHGTNIRWSIGRLATHGCIRLYDDEMRALFERVPSGTPVRLVYQPFKWGREGDAIVLEAHPDLYARLEDPLAEALAVPGALGLLGAIDLEAVRRAVAEARGVPVVTGRRPAPEAAPATSIPIS